MMAPWEVAEAAAIDAARRLVAIAPGTTEDLQKLLADHDAAEDQAELAGIRRELHAQLADALRHFKAHRKGARTPRPRRAA